MRQTNSQKLTTLSGSPISDDNNSYTAGEFGPVLLQDSYLIQKLQKLNREKLLEKPMFPKGAGAHGYFEVTDDVTKYCKAKFLSMVGKQTPVLIRFADMINQDSQIMNKRDIRGFQIKFYTEEGNLDVLGQNFPVSYIRDAMKLSDLVHALNKDPLSNLKDPNRFWDFMSLNPESIQAIMMLFSSRGIPANLRQMNGYGVHTFKWVNAQKEGFWIKYHFISEQGVSSVKQEDTCKLEGDYTARDLYQNIEKGNYPAWSFYVQAIPLQDAYNLQWDIFDPTKVWPHTSYPLIKVGRIVLNKNPENYFQDIEQSAFCSSNLVPGIEPSTDKLLQGKLFADLDGEVHRLGPNYYQLPVNQPKNAQVVSNAKNGQMNIDQTGATKNPIDYYPSQFSENTVDKSAKQVPYRISGVLVRVKYGHPNSDFSQAGDLYKKVFKDQERKEFVKNITQSLKQVKKQIQEKQIQILYKCDIELAQEVANNLGHQVVKSHL